MKCPNCNETLLMSQRNNVEIDYCPNCRGVWLDRGELDKILDFAAGQSSTAYGDHHEGKRDHYEEKKHYGDSHRHHKKKSFLDDFFDFG